MDNNVEAVKNAVLASGMDDWVHIAEVVSAARQARSGQRPEQGYPDDSTMSIDDLGRLRSEWLARSEREALPLGVSAVKELLRAGLVRIGEVSDSGFVAWRGSVEEIESLIDGVVQEAEYPLLPGHLFWIENTPLGDEVARSGGRPV
jgi:hypothetical protein